MYDVSTADIIIRNMEYLGQCIFICPKDIKLTLPDINLIPDQESAFGRSYGPLSQAVTCLDHNALTSIVSYNLPFFPTTGTLYQSIP